MKADLERCLGCEILKDWRVTSDELEGLAPRLLPLYKIDAIGFWRHSWLHPASIHCYRFLSEWSSRLDSSQAILLVGNEAIEISPQLVLENVEAMLCCCQEFALIDVSGDGVLELSKEEDSLVLSIDGEAWRSIAESVEQ